MTVKEMLQDILRRFGYEVRRIGYFDVLESLIMRNYSKDFFFIQIGANDGKRFDPIYRIVKKLNLTGIAIEPIKEYFDELKETYKNTRVKVINNAIYEKNGVITLYKVDSKSDLPEWSKGIASINPEHHKRLGIESKYIIEEQVTAITFDKLLDTNDIRRIHLLQIDTEGYDCKIIKMIPFSSIKPELIHFEHGLKDNVVSMGELLKCIETLLNNGYKIAIKEYDCLAYL